MRAKIYTNNIDIVCGKVPAIKGWHDNVAIDLVYDDDGVTSCY